MISHCVTHCPESSQTKAAGHSLAHSLYLQPLTILLTGELGAGKTTFAQGFAAGLGLEDNVLSPTYALEQRYTSSFTHLDLYRLSKEQAEEFLRHSEDTEGIRLIEWADRIDHTAIGPHIHIFFSDTNGVRTLDCLYNDEPVPSDKDIDAWMEEVRLPANVRDHSEVVTRVADRLAEFLIEHRHWLIRKEALHAAARTHDLLRFVDFKEWKGDKLREPTNEDLKTWERMKDQFGTPHEEAVGRFLTHHGYTSIGTIATGHRGIERDGSPAKKQTTEQKLLAYADKRVALDQIVSIDERFDDIIARHGKTNADYMKKWRNSMKEIEKELFPEGVPDLKRIMNQES